MTQDSARGAPGSVREEALLARLVLTLDAAASLTYEGSDKEQQGERKGAEARKDTRASALRFLPQIWANARQGGRSVSENPVAQTGTWHERACVAKRREAHAEGGRCAGVRVGHSLGVAHSAELWRDGMKLGRYESHGRKRSDGNEPDGYWGKYLLKLNSTFDFPDRQNLAGSCPLIKFRRSCCSRNYISSNRAHGQPVKRPSV